MSIEKFNDLYAKHDNFLVLLDSIAVMTKIDSAFLLFDRKFSDKIYFAIRNNRRKYYHDEEINNIINSIISYINEAQAYELSYKNILKNNYLAYQEDCRGIDFNCEQIFFEYLAFDALTLTALKNNSNMEFLKENDTYFLASINYFIEVIPEIFKDKPIYKQTMLMLDELVKKGWPFSKSNRIFSRKTKENLQKVKVIEEY